MLTHQDLSALAARARRPREIALGVYIEELCELLGLNRLTVARYFNPAAIIAAHGGRPTLFSRSGVSAILSEINGRPIGFPSISLLSFRDVVTYAKSRGIPLTLAAANWGAWRATNPDDPRAFGQPAPVLPSLAVTPRTRRVYPADAAAYVEAWRTYESPYKRGRS